MSYNEAIKRKWITNDNIFVVIDESDLVMREASVDFFAKNQTNKLALQPISRIKMIGEMKNVICFSGSVSESTLELMSSKTQRVYKFEIKSIDNKV